MPFKGLVIDLLLQKSSVSYACKPIQIKKMDGITIVHLSSAVLRHHRRSGPTTYVKHSVLR